MDLPGLFFLGKQFDLITMEYVASAKQKRGKAISFSPSSFGVVWNILIKEKMLRLREREVC